MKYLFQLFIVCMTFVFLLTPLMSAYAATYIVQSGDSLYSIGLKHGISVQNLIETNQLTTTLLKPGQKLIIPENKTETDNNSVGREYIVKQGDTLYQIAINFNTTIQAIKTANNLTTELIHPNQALIIPGRNDTVDRGSADRPKIPYTEQDLDLLARLIAAEAGNESATAKICVGAVVVNRTASSKFPNSIQAVIYQPGQFGPVRTGLINNPAPQSCVQAAKEALAGSDPTNGALFFFDTGTKDKYLRSLPIALQDGNLIFARPR